MDTPLEEQLKSINEITNNMVAGKEILVSRIKVTVPSHLVLVVNNGKSIGRKRRKK